MFVCPFPTDQKILKIRGAFAPPPSGGHFRQFFGFLPNHKRILPHSMPPISGAATGVIFFRFRFLSFFFIYILNFCIFKQNC